MSVRLVLISVTLAAWTASAGGPPQLRYEGYLPGTDQLVGTSTTLVFKLYNVVTGGAPLAQETHTVKIVDGWYLVTIGSTHPNPPLLAAVLTNRTVFVEVLAGGSVVGPRVPLQAPAYPMLLKGNRSLEKAVENDRGGGAPGRPAPGWVIDAFDNVTGRASYRPHGPTDLVVSQAGYGVYFAKADFDISHIRVGATGTALKLQYHLPPYRMKQNWMSVRKNLDDPVDLSEYDGLEITLQVALPADARLRLTLADVDEFGRDELWWFDFPDVLQRSTPGWITISAPFEAFYLSHGGGTRHNDGHLDLGRIAAYEFNIISLSTAHPNGVIALHALTAYEQGALNTIDYLPRFPAMHELWRLQSRTLPLCLPAGGHRRRQGRP